MSGSERGVKLFYMAEYCDTLQSKEKRNREHKACLNERAILRLLDQDVTWKSGCFSVAERGDFSWNFGFFTARENGAILGTLHTRPSTPEGRWDWSMNSLRRALSLFYMHPENQVRCSQ